MAYRLIVNRTGDYITFKNKVKALSFVKSTGREPNEFVLERDESAEDFFSIIRNSEGVTEVIENNITEEKGIAQVKDKKDMFCMETDKIIEGWPKGIVQDNVSSLFSLRM